MASLEEMLTKMSDQIAMQTGTFVAEDYVAVCGAEAFSPVSTSITEKMVKGIQCLKDERVASKDVVLMRKEDLFR